MLFANDKRTDKILIVDDEKLNLFALFDALKKDYDISVANSGKMALDIVEKVAPDLILMDIVMPDLDGYEVMKRLKENEATSDIPIIFVTGLTNPADETKGLFFGAVDYISKPFNVDVVYARVRTHLRIASQMRLIERMGMIDPLTEIPNRRRFDQQLEIDWARAIREQTPISLLMLDVDNFKDYNDTYGHPAGDALLQAFARTAVSRLRRPPDLLARIGGEEFAVMLPATDLRGALQVAEDIRAAMEDLNIPSGLDPQKAVTVSIGVGSVVPARNSAVADFVKYCDANLYLAKKAGKNQVVWQPEA